MCVCALVLLTQWFVSRLSDGVACLCLHRLIARWRHSAPRRRFFAELWRCWLFRCFFPPSFANISRGLAIHPDHRRSIIIASQVNFDDRLSSVCDTESITPTCFSQMNVQLTPCSLVCVCVHRLIFCERKKSYSQSIGLQAINKLTKNKATGFLNFAAFLCFGFDILTEARRLETIVMIVASLTSNILLLMIIVKSLFTPRMAYMVFTIEVQSSMWQVCVREIDTFEHEDIHCSVLDHFDTWITLVESYSTFIFQQSYCEK